MNKVGHAYLVRISGLETKVEMNFVRKFFVETAAMG